MKCGAKLFAFLGGQYGCSQKFTFSIPCWIYCSRVDSYREVRK